MKIRNRWLACAGLGTMIFSAAAMAAVNAGELHLALTSLKLALAKIGVANAMLGSPTPPASNAEAHLAAPEQLGSPEISAIRVSAGGVINVYLTPATGATGGIVQFVPRIVPDKQGKKGVEYSCSSPNIPDIATVAPECTYHAAGG